MQAEPAGGFRGFLRSKVGRVVFILLVIGVVFATYAYVATLLAIPVFLIVGLGLPVYAGLKRPRFLALAALIVLLAVAPLATVVFSQELLVPPGSANSAGAAPYEVGGPVLQNATISPFSGSSATNFTWNVSLYPKYLNASFAHTNWSNATLDLYISTCPGATAPNLSYCGGSYTLLTVLHAFSTAPTNGAVVTFHDRIASTGIWSWQMELRLQNTSNVSNPYKFELVGDPTYDGLEGPIVGGFSVVYTALVVTVYEVEFVYLGIPFFFVLLLYVWFKSREARRKDAVRRAASAKPAASPPASTTIPPSGPGSGPPTTSPSAPSQPASSELACPSCGAVIYPNEAKCWKCGASLGGPPAPAPPLPSAPK